MVPERFGGYQTSVRTYIDVMAELGRGCGSTAWVASLINVCAWLAALFPEQAQADVWGSDPDAWIAGSLAPNGAAVAVDGGWRVTGRWPWASGSMHAQWAACGIHMKDDAGERATPAVLMPMTAPTIEDTWFMAGMKGTGSTYRRHRRVRRHTALAVSGRLAAAAPSTTDEARTAWRSCR
jgi:alkylation response protein AidB-like acyl-CoA dehydrogenase